MRDMPNQVQQQDGLLDSGHLSTLVLEATRQTAPFLRIVAYVTLGGAALSIVAAVGTLWAADMGHLGILAILPHLIWAAVGTAAGLNLRSAAIAARRVGQRGLLSDLEDTLGHQLLYWRIVGTMSALAAGMVVMFLGWMALNLL